MYDEHNGHLMVPVREMANTIKQNITDLSKMIMNTRRLTEDNLNLLEQAREELHKLLSHQTKRSWPGRSPKAHLCKFQVLAEDHARTELELQRGFTFVTMSWC